MILRLAYRDVLHDRLLSACLVLAIASIIAPLLILFGLQFGTIETLRHRLVQDPKNREIRPMTTKSYERDWFASFKAENPEVAFIIPMTRQIAASILAINAAADARESLSLLASAPGDPLLLENGGAIPGQGECVLTAAAAAALKVKAGDHLEFSAQRIVQGRYENAPLRVVVKGILEERASGLKTAFVSLELIEAVEDFKDGRAVPAYGWQGELPLAYAVFDGAVVLVPEPLSKLDEVLLVNNTGFAQIQAVSVDQLPALLGTAQPGSGRPTNYGLSNTQPARSICGRWRASCAGVRHGFFRGSNPCRSVCGQWTWRPHLRHRLLCISRCCPHRRWVNKSTVPAGRRLNASSIFPLTCPWKERPWCPCAWQKGNSIYRSPCATLKCPQVGPLLRQVSPVALICSVFGRCATMSPPIPCYFPDKAMPVFASTPPPLMPWPPCSNAWRTQESQ